VLESVLESALLPPYRPFWSVYRSQRFPRSVPPQVLSVPAGSVPVGSAPDEVLHPPVLVAQCAEPEASPPVFAGSVPAGAPVVPVVSPLVVDVCPVESVSQVPVPVWHPA
jgi:hypothetical protein